MLILATDDSFSVEMVTLPSSGLFPPSFSSLMRTYFGVAMMRFFDKFGAVENNALSKQTGYGKGNLDMWLKLACASLTHSTSRPCVGLVGRPGWLGSDKRRPKIQPTLSRFRDMWCISSINLDSFGQVACELKAHTRSNTTRYSPQQCFIILPTRMN